jgi:uncharacterized membrane protein (DUF485 family)
LDGTCPRRSDLTPAQSKTRLGLIFFAVYGSAYTAFVLLSAFRPDVMARVSLGGVNLSVVYGMGLIVGAFALALLYCWLLRKQ